MRFSRLKLLFVAVILIIAVLLPLGIFASSYTSTLNFTATCTGPTRNYTGQDMNISMSCTTDTPPYHPVQDFRVELYRSNFLGPTYIGSTRFLRAGSNSAAWTNVGSGDYYFYFSKAIDNYYVDSGNVLMCN